MSNLVFLRGIGCHLLEDPFHILDVAVGIILETTAKGAESSLLTELLSEGLYHEPGKGNIRETLG